MTQVNWRRAARLLGVSIGSLSALFVASLAADSRAAETALAAKTRTLVVTYLWNAFPGDAKDCPDGENTPPDKEIAISKLPADQQEAYRKDDAKSQRILTHRGPKGEDVCVLPTLVPDPGFKISQSKIQDGFDLEHGLPASQSCKHPQLTSPLGQTGVDNQLSRVMGCVKHRRADGFFPKYFVNQMRSGEYAYLIEISGIDNERNDDSVEVGLYASGDPMVLDTAGKPLSDASLQLTSDTKYIHHLKGRIKDGVLVTDAQDVLMPFGSVFPALDLKHAMLRLSFKPDGSAEGALGGYQSWEGYYRGNTGAGGLSETSGGPFQCPALYNALKNAADGLRNATTGECDGISAAYRIEAIPAFVIHPKPGTVAAR